MDQKLLQDVAHIMRAYYDGHGSNLESFATVIINQITKVSEPTIHNSIKRVYKTSDLIEKEEYLVIELPDPLAFSTVVKWDVYLLEEIKTPAMSNTFKLNNDMSYKFIKEDSSCTIIATKVLTLNNKILSNSIEIYRTI